MRLEVQATRISPAFLSVSFALRVTPAGSGPVLAAAPTGARNLETNGATKDKK